MATLGEPKRKYSAGDVIVAGVPLVIGNNMFFGLVKYYWVVGYRGEGDRKVYGPFSSKEGAESTAENLQHAEIFESQEKDRYKAIQDIKAQMSRRKPSKLVRAAVEPDGSDDNFNQQEEF